MDEDPQPDISTRLSTADFIGETDEDTSEARRVFDAAGNYLTGFAWCDGIRASFVGIVVAPVVAVTLFEIEPIDDGVPSWIWTVTGDLPPLYLEFDDEISATPQAALELYCELMQNWVSSVRGEESGFELPPVAVEPTEHNADLLEKRIRFLQRDFVDGGLASYWN